MLVECMHTKTALSKHTAWGSKWIQFLQIASWDSKNKNNCEFVWVLQQESVPKWPRLRQSATWNGNLPPQFFPYCTLELSQFLNWFCLFSHPTHLMTNLGRKKTMHAFACNVRQTPSTILREAGEDSLFFCKLLINAICTFCRSYTDNRKTMTSRRSTVVGVDEYACSV